MLQFSGTSQIWVDRILALGLGAGLLQFIQFVLNRVWNKKKTQSELDREEAETEKIKVETTIKASDQLIRLADILSHAKADKERSERELELKEIHIQIIETENVRLKGLLKANNISYSEFITGK